MNKCCAGKSDQFEVERPEVERPEVERIEVHPLRQMLAVEQYSYAETDEYITLFHRYISRSIEKLRARLGPELEGLTNETREEAWHLLDYALKLAHGWEVARELLLALAPRMERDGFRHEWLPFLERGIDACQRAHDAGSEAQLALYIGRLHRLRGDYAPAVTWFEQSAGLCGESGDKAGRAKALNQLAYVARLQSEYGVTTELVQQALSLLDEDDVERAHSHWVLGTMGTSTLAWADAEFHHNAAWQIWQKAGDQQRAAWSLQNLGNTLRGAGRYAEAADVIQQAIVLLGQLHDPVNQAIARMNRGVVHIYDQDPAQALALFQLAEPVFRQVGDQLHLGMIYVNMMIVQRELGHLEAAAESGLKAVRFFEVLDDLKMVANAKDELGLVYLAQARRADAIGVFEEGLALIDEAAPDPFQKMVQESLQTHLAEATEKGNT
jgi:tetratricopeptide (TPR) repeat protein